jgi:hypothetical protein
MRVPVCAVAVEPSIAGERTAHAAGGAPARAALRRIGGEALPPITQRPARIALKDRRQIGKLTRDTRAPLCGIGREPGVGNGLRQVGLLRR